MDMGKTKPLNINSRSNSFDKKELSLNAICPYYTMFPLDFPLKHLNDVYPNGLVYDPFCGRGTTAYAARLLGLSSINLDVNPVAVAVARAKLASAKPGTVVRLANCLLDTAVPDPKPRGEFWNIAFHPETLNDILKLRAGLRSFKGPVADALIGIVLGALHGPTPKNKDSHFSNQMQRTFAPKPDYAVRFWTEKNIYPRKVNVISIIQERAERYYSEIPEDVPARVLMGDSRKPPIRKVRFSATVTSPPYFGMDTYFPDQWLRNWFLGGPDHPVYEKNNQLSQGDAKKFISNLQKVWRSVATRSTPDAKLVIRFGAIGSRHSDPESIIIQSLTYKNSPWKVNSIDCAGGAEKGHRQVMQMGSKANRSKSIEEIDVVCHLR